MATVHGSDAAAYDSGDFEGGTVAYAEDGPLPEGVVVRMDDCAYIEAWMTGIGDDGIARGTGYRLESRSRGGPLPEERWLDPETRIPRRLYLERIAFERIVHVIGTDRDPHVPIAPGRR